MSASNTRRRAIEAILEYEVPEKDFLSEPLGDLFGRNVFSRSVMKARLPKTVFKSLMQTIDEGARLDPTIADVVASAMKDWAVENGASHYAHVFYPLTGLTAESMTASSNPMAPAHHLLSSPERRCCRVSLMHRVSPTVAFE